MGTKYHTSTVNTKSGSVSVTEDSSEAITFTTAFAATPHITVSVDETSPEHYVSVSGVSTTGFTVYLDKPGGGPAGSCTVYWMATDIGNN